MALQAPRCAFLSATAKLYQRFSVHFSINPMENDEVLHNLLSHTESCEKNSKLPVFSVANPIYFKVK